MSWQELIPWATQGGITAVIVYIGYRLHVDAVAAHKERADDWERAYRAERAAREVREQQLSILLGRPPKDG